MFRETKQSPYSKMYLVTPMVYEKLKKCLNKIDKEDIEGLNKKYQPRKQDESNMALQSLSTREIKPDPPPFQSQYTPKPPQKEEESGEYVNEESTGGYEEVPENYQINETGIYQPEVTQNEVGEYQVENYETASETPEEEVPMETVENEEIRAIEGTPAIESYPESETLNLVYKQPLMIESECNNESPLSKCGVKGKSKKLPVARIKGQNIKRKVKYFERRPKELEIVPPKIVIEEYVDPGASTSKQALDEDRLNSIPMDIEQPEKGKKDWKKFMCDLCGKWFSRRYAVNRHKNTFHVRRGIQYETREAIPQETRQEIGYEFQQRPAITYESRIKSPVKKVIPRSAITYEVQPKKALTYESQKSLVYKPRENVSVMYQPNETVSYQPQKKLNFPIKVTMNSTSKVKPTNLPALTYQPEPTRMSKEITFKPKINTSKILPERELQGPPRSFKVPKRFAEMNRNEYQSDTEDMDISNKSLAQKRPKQFQLKRQEKTVRVSEPKDEFYTETDTEDVPLAKLYGGKKRKKTLKSSLPPDLPNRRRKLNREREFGQWDLG